MTSGYTHCACRDCFEPVVSNDMANPDYCEDCTEHQCDGGECQAPEVYNHALYETR